MGKSAVDATQPVHTRPVHTAATGTCTKPTQIKLERGIIRKRQDRESLETGYSKKPEIKENNVKMKKEAKSRQPL